MISVCMIVKNEGALLEECILSVLKIAEEIIIIDNGSSDNTIQIAQKYGCKVIHSIKSLDLARGAYMQAARMPWILTIDADERMQEVDKEFLYNTLAATPEDVWAYRIRGIQYIGYGKWAEIDQIRLFRNNGLVEYNDSDIHATVIPSIYKHGAKIGNIPIYYHHVDIIVHNRTDEKRLRYILLLTQKLNDINFKIEDIHTYSLYQIFLGMEYVANQDYTSAERMFNDALSLNTRYRVFAKISLCRLFILQRRTTLIAQYFSLSDLVFNTESYDEDFYDIADILLNYYYHVNKVTCIEIYDELFKYGIARTSDFINKAFLLIGGNFEQGQALMLSAIKRNPYLTRSAIYGQSNPRNLFSQQSCFLSEITNVYHLMKHYKLEDHIRIC